MRVCSVKAAKVRVGISPQPRVHRVDMRCGACKCVCTCVCVCVHVCVAAAEGQHAAPTPAPAYLFSARPAGASPSGSFARTLPHAVSSGQHPHAVASHPACVSVACLFVWTRVWALPACHAMPEARGRIHAGP